MEIYFNYEHDEAAMKTFPLRELAQFVLDAEEAPENSRVGVTFVDNDEIHRLNREFRGIDKPTDVLSFEGEDDDEWPEFGLPIGVPDDFESNLDNKPAGPGGSYDEPVGVGGPGDKLLATGNLGKVPLSAGDLDDKSESAGNLDDKPANAGELDNKPAGPCELDDVLAGESGAQEPLTQGVALDHELALELALDHDHDRELDHDLAFDRELDLDLDDVPFELGDVIIAPDVARAQCGNFNMTLEGEISLLLTHGLLHLCGYDHIEDDEAAEMQAREIELLGEWAKTHPDVAPPDYELNTEMVTGDH